MRRQFQIFAAPAFWLVACFSFAGLRLVRADDRFGREARPFLQTYCFACHSAEKHKGDVVLTRFSNEEELAKDQDQWLDVITQLQGYLMPPAKAKQPSAAERNLVVARLTDAMDRIDEAAPLSPGRTLIHRLNRAEYNNTIRDLVGVDFQPADDFPADDTAHGFDNVAEALSLPPLLLEKDLAAAEQVVGKALPDSAAAPVSEESSLTNWNNARLTNGAVDLKLEQEITRTFESPAAGDFEIQIVATQTGSSEEPATLVLKIDGVDTHVWSLPDEGKTQSLVARVPIGAGPRRIALRHTWYMEVPKGKTAPRSSCASNTPR